MTEAFSTIADALSPRYRLERTLQHGAAAHVFLAEDRRHARWVAVKVLRAELSSTVDAQRFTAEIRCCAQLRHPNIVPVYESSDLRGLPYYVMPFVDGETVRARLARLGRLPLGEALRIAEDVARALDFAHRHDTVHRDIKPENVMLYRGRALVLDFGIALALDKLDTPRRTLPGLALGTLQYMSPEQASAEPHVDGRSDVYSLACVMYEMIAGHPPFTGSPATVIRRHIAETPRPVTSVCPGTPPNVGRVLDRALAKTPDARFPTAGSFVAALAAAMPRVRVVGRRIAVLPFTHVGPNPRVDPFGDGISEDVAFMLRGVEGVVIAPAGPTERELGEASLGALARRFDADFLLLADAHETASGDRVRLAASLYDARRGQRLWTGDIAGRFHSGLDEPSEVAREIARAVVSALGLPMRLRASQPVMRAASRSPGYSTNGWSTGERAAR